MQDPLSMNPGDPTNGMPMLYVVSTLMNRFNFSNELSMVNAVRRDPFSS
jgi:hypothetical protein